jgi:hypothetical protein
MGLGFGKADLSLALDFNAMARSVGRRPGAAERVVQTARRLIAQVPGKNQRLLSSY